MLILRPTGELFEATRVGGPVAAMVVHSFSAMGSWYEDYRAFGRLMGGDGAKGRLERAARHTAVELWLGWVAGGA